MIYDLHGYGMCVNITFVRHGSARNHTHKHRDLIHFAMVTEVTDEECFHADRWGEAANETRIMTFPHLYPHLKY